MNNKRLISGCVITIVIFGLVSYIFSGYQEEAKGKWTGFLEDKSIDGETIAGYACLTRKQKSVLEGNLGEEGVKISDELWKRYRYFDYWRSVCSTITAVALIIIIVKLLRIVLGRIYVSESFYRKFYLPPDEIGKGKEKREK